MIRRSGGFLRMVFLGQMTWAALALVAPSGRAQVTFAVVEVKPPQAEKFSQATSLDNLGRVAGVSYPPAASPTTAFVDTGPGQVSLTPLPGAALTWATRILDDGQVIGFSGANFVDSKAVVWDLNGNVRELRGLKGFPLTVAWGGNAKSEFVGMSSMQNTVLDQPVLWRSGVLIPLPKPAGKAYGRMRAINNRGVMVGYAWNFTSDTVGYTIGAQGELTTIGTLPGGLLSGLTDINDAGVAIGFASNAAGFVVGVYYRNKRLVPLTPLPGSTSTSMNAINRSSVAVGTAVGTPLRGVIASGTTLVDLNGLLDPVTGSGWTIQQAVDINDHGQIASVGLNPAGEQVGCVLTPLP